MRLGELKPLYDLGFSLIYLHPREKRPIGNNWTKKPRKSWKQIKDEYRPENNIGVRLGEISKVEGGYLCCIDVDVKDPAYRKIALKKLKEITNGKAYPTVFSGSGNGSRHLYARSSEPFQQIEIEKHKGKWEIVAYSNGRQMVLPPSIHPDTGKAYRWREGIQPDRLPLFNPETFQRGSISVEVPGRMEQGTFKAEEVNLYESKLGLDTIAQIETGKGVEDRSACLMSIAMKMCRQGFTDNQILSVLSDPAHWISETAYEHTQSRKRDRAVKWLYKYTLLKARYETHPLRLFEGQPNFRGRKRSPEKIKREREDVEEEIRETFPDKDGNGNPKSSLRNVVHIIDAWMGQEGGLVGFDEFGCRPYFLRDTPYGGMKGREVTDKDDLALKHHIACHYRFEPSKELCFEAHAIVAQKYKYHPVKAYLEGLEWDGVPRLDHWLQDAFRATGPEQYLKAVSRKILCAAVARIYEPGCKFDYMAVLEGNQGEGKSMSLGMLVGPRWFVDRLGDINNKDVIDQMLGKWLIEVSELDSIRGRELEAVKAFVSRQVDRARLSYARRAEDYPRQCIFIGSTNDQEYLTDPTGNRRYWPVKVGTARRKWLARTRDQLWAEAKFRYELGEKLYLPKELEEVAKVEQEKRFEVDPWEGLLKNIVEKEEGDGVYQTVELFRALTMSIGTPSLPEGHRIGKIMQRLGFRRSAKRIEGVLHRCWTKQRSWKEG